MFYLFVITDRDGLTVEVTTGCSGFDLLRNRKVFVGAKECEDGSLIMLQQGKSKTMVAFSPVLLANPLRVQGANLLLPIKRSQEKHVKETFNLMP